MSVNPSKPDHIDRLEPAARRGLVVVLTGNGKGKTSSALGMAVRAAGHEMRVRIVQFMKGDLYAGEWDGIPMSTLMRYLKWRIVSIQPA